ncbi:ATP synthase F0 [Dinoroseobacter shibae DFL 12 = DSM 16493]|jgi:F-type H+-transporting ATPase subunit b|uniref:ATP synthase subunit b 3 n=1 Tax=Dinoroseobacter shibae (strain DSM 16493 / NCIMB 14021 / DFL 12) TaxID=398580 RepID=ATPF3_DINSH|nr:MULTISPECIES: F0F1 ATP synthase subunit B [Dinoroseobacter]A8LKH7.1 RecName: Full=ATP synthase subunit b 3; AltName: Full=ATP synthase F(0) sector subunit b 3; AltName: Full=ATPase subunit I 3; AltName: Full=F-type ATPase subunit b 3; Short=F-ATPase subunit b 3 [Dinoroseobacter shibae DFL 12 = DSM 16493]ABV94760.1 ATP synthase F0 [Dinoroseobacter shibae DFL 12 = DSM 16493]MDD9716798.1 F0F1 ATP synthase subunit B [Dinoroseobacter sp. PD6]URF46180.1 F0F1 ATP synthase subunit B [Dinoroseobacter
MKKLLLPALLTFSATPALAAKGPFFSLANTDFIVLISFIAFIGVLVYFKIPGILSGMLDKRAEGIKAELEEAKALREEAQTLLASYERKQREVQAQADAIVATAKEDAEAAAAQAKVDLEASIARRLATAEDQLASAQAAAIKEVKDKAVTVAIAAAADVISSKLGKAELNALNADAIKEVKAKLH